MPDIDHFDRLIGWNGTTKKMLLNYCDTLLAAGYKYWFGGKNALNVLSQICQFVMWILSVAEISGTHAWAADIAWNFCHRQISELFVFRGLCGYNTSKWNRCQYSYIQMINIKRILYWRTERYIPVNFALSLEVRIV